MMTVEVLRDMVLAEIGDYKRCHTQDILDCMITAGIDRLIAAARAERVDRERMRILMERDHVPQDANERVFLIPVRAFSPPAFAPLHGVYGDSLPIKETPCSG